MKTIKIIIFLIFTTVMTSFANSEIKSELKVVLTEDSLTYNVKIINNSDSIIYILLDNWAIYGNEKSNSFLAFVREGFLVNTFWYFPKRYQGIRYRTEMSDYPLYKNVPTIRKICCNDSFDIIVSFKRTIKDADSLTFMVMIPYLYQSIESVIEPNKCEFHNNIGKSFNLNLYNSLSNNDKYLFVNDIMESLNEYQAKELFRLQDGYINATYDFIK